MGWMRDVDIYCERLGPGIWAEPVNALTNLGFVVAAVVMWRRIGPESVPGSRVLCVMLGAIGLASLAFHTFGQVWAGAADSLAIVVFALSYVYLANRCFLGMRRGHAILATTALLPCAAVAAYLFTWIPGLSGSAPYMPLPVMILAYAWWLRGRAPQTARGLATGAAILLVSLVFRTVDGPVCTRLSVGTHFVWHLLNAVMLGWMIEVYCRHVRDLQDMAGFRAGRFGSRS